MRALCVLCLLLTSCVTATWQREHRFQRPPSGSIGSLKPETDQLSDCLERLGAPLFVYETPDGFAIAYGWFASQELGASVSVPVSEAANASFAVRGIDSRMKGLVLFFGPRTELLLVRRGPLRDLTMGAGRTRPTYVPEEG